MPAALLSIMVQGQFLARPESRCLDAAFKHRGQIGGMATPIPLAIQFVIAMPVITTIRGRILVTQFVPGYTNS